MKFFRWIKWIEIIVYSWVGMLAIRGYSDMLSILEGYDLPWCWICILPAFLALFSAGYVIYEHKLNIRMVINSCVIVIVLSGYIYCYIARYIYLESLFDWKFWLWCMVPLIPQICSQINLNGKKRR